MAEPPLLSCKNTWNAVGVCQPSTHTSEYSPLELVTVGSTDVALSDVRLPTACTDRLATDVALNTNCTVNVELAFNVMFAGMLNDGGKVSVIKK